MWIHWQKDAEDGAAREEEKRRTTDMQMVGGIEKDGREKMR